MQHLLWGGARFKVFLPRNLGIIKGTYSGVMQAKSLHVKSRHPHIPLELFGKTRWRTLSRRLLCCLRAKELGPALCVITGSRSFLHRLETGQFDPIVLNFTPKRPPKRSVLKTGLVLAIRVALHTKPNVEKRRDKNFVGPTQL